MYRYFNISTLLFFVFIVSNTFSQKKIDPWNKLVEEKKCKVSFIFYSKADNYNNGIVIKIENKNKFNIRYRFTIIVKTNKLTKEKIYQGDLEGGKLITGSNSNLFWVPDLKGESIAEVGIKKWKFNKFIRSR